MSCASTRPRTAWWRFTPDVSGTYVFHRCSEPPVVTGTHLFSATNGTIATAFAIYTGAACAGFTQLTCLGTNTCGVTATGSAVALTAGTDYYILVAIGTSTVPAAFADTVGLRVSLLEPPPPTGDVCASARPLTANRPLEGFVTGAANDYQLDGGAACYAGLGHSTANLAPGRDMTFSFTAPATGTYSLRSRGTTSNIVLYTSDACVAGPAPQTVACSAAANRTTTTSNTSIEEISCVPLATGSTLYAYVDELTSSTGVGPFELEVSPCTREAEPNDTPPQANPPACPLTGSISVAGEADFVSLGSPAAGSRVFAIAEGGAASSNTFDLRVTTATDTLEYDDLNADGEFGASAPVIAGRQLTGAPTFLRVNATTAAEPYRLYSVVQPAGATPAPEAEPNDTLATAGSDTVNYFSGTIASASDVDYTRSRPSPATSSSSRSTKTRSATEPSSSRGSACSTRAAATSRWSTTPAPPPRPPAAPAA